ncbi:MAG: hypothetical protein ACRDNY_01070 [Gaiellaceae bacterium]
MSVRHLLAPVVGTLVIAALAGESGSATAGYRSSCGAGSAGNGGYTYAGHQATYRGHGVRATISATRTPRVDAGHVAGWVGVGGPGQGANGEDAWIQAGIGSVPGTKPFLYAEITRDGRDPQFILLDDSVDAGESRSVAILELSRRPGWWRVWIDGNPATEPVQLRGSSGRWAPIATAESFDGGRAACNTFSFRFERVSVSYGGGGAWRPFVSGHRFLDGGHQLREVAAAPATSGAYARSISSRTALPYAFVASS